MEDASYNQILTVNTNNPQIGTPAITASGEVSMSGTGSFGRVNATYFRGDGSDLTFTTPAGMASSSVQLSSDISGSWQGDLSQSEYTYPEYLAGEESGLTFVSGGLTGSVSSTASFGRIEAGKVRGDASQMTSLIPDYTISESVQISSQISGSWQNEFSSSAPLQISGGISSSMKLITSNSFQFSDGGPGYITMGSNFASLPIASSSRTMAGWVKTEPGRIAGGYSDMGLHPIIKI